MSIPSSPITHQDDQGLDSSAALLADDVPALPPIRKQLPTSVLGVLTLLSFVVLSLATWSALSH